MNGPPASLRDRVLETAANRPSATRTTHRQRRLALMILILALLVASSSMLAANHAEMPARPIAYLVTMVSTSFVLAIATAYSMLAPTSSALGRSSRFYSGLMIIAPFALAIAALLANFVAPSTWIMPEGVRAPHISCSTITLVTGAGLLVVLMFLERCSATNSVVLKGASLGVVAAAWATLFISISCPFTHPMHVIPTHILLPVVPLVLGGAVAGARVLAMRANRMK